MNPVGHAHLCPPPREHWLRDCGAEVIDLAVPVPTAVTRGGGDRQHSVGAEPVLPDAWGADLCVIGARKAMGGPADLPPHRPPRRSECGRAWRRRNLRPGPWRLTEKVLNVNLGAARQAADSAWR